MELLKKNSNRYIILGAIIIAGVSYETIYTGIQRIYAPFSLTVALPAVLLWYPLGHKFHFCQFLAWPLACSIIPLFFVAWTRKLYLYGGKIPLRSIIFFSIMAALSFLMLATNWNYGIKYQGKIHTLVMYSWNLLFWIAMVFLYRENRKKPTFMSSFLFHLVSFIWLAWVSFPWLGELL